LKISVVSTGKYIMPYFLSAFMNQHPGIELLMDVTNKNKVIKSLENNEVDFALVSLLPQNLNIVKMDLLQNKLFLVGSNKTKFKRGLKITEKFQDLPIIFREKGSGTRHSMEEFFTKNNIPVLKKMELTSNEAVKQAVMAGLGYSIMPLIGLRNELNHQQLHIIPIKGLPITTTWSLIWVKEKKHSPISQSFLNHLAQHKSDIVQEKFSWYEQY